MFERPITTASRPGKVAEPVLEQHQAAQRRAGDEPGLADREPAGIVDVEAVDVLGRVDRGDHRLLVDLRRQRQLDEDAVDRVVGVEPRDQGEQLVLADVSAGRRVLEARHAGRVVALPLERT